MEFICCNCNRSVVNIKNRKLICIGENNFYCEECELEANAMWERNKLIDKKYIVGEKWK